MTPTTTPTEKRRVARATQLAVEAFPPDAAGLLPEPVQEANKVLVEATAAAAEARRAVGLAEEDLAAARAKDAEAARRSLDEGGAPPKARTATKAEDKLDGATRLRAATAERLLRAKRGLIDATREHQTEILAAIDAERERVAMEAAAVAAGLVVHLRRVQGLRALRREVDTELEGREVILRPDVMDRAAERLDLAALDAVRDMCAPPRHKTDAAELTDDERTACEQARAAGLRQPRFESESYVAFAQRWAEAVGS